MVCISHCVDLQLTVSINNARSCILPQKLLKILYCRKSMLSVSFVARRRCFAYGLALSHFLWLSVSFTKVLKIRKSLWKKSLFSCERNKSFLLPLLSFRFFFFRFLLIFLAKYNLEYSFFGGEGALSFPLDSLTCNVLNIQTIRKTNVSNRFIFNHWWQPRAAWARAGASNAGIYWLSKTAAAHPLQYLARPCGVGLVLKHRIFYIFPSANTSRMISWSFFSLCGRCDDEWRTLKKVTLPCVLFNVIFCTLYTLTKKWKVRGATVYKRGRKTNMTECISSL